MRISVIGCGYLGAVHAAGMAELGHDVVGLDVDAAKVELLAAGTAPFHEPGLPELLQRGVASGRLRFTTDPAELADAELHFIGVGTPQMPGRLSADLSYVWSAADAIATHGTPGSLIVGKSTVPVGTAEQLVERVGGRFQVAWNPEFLREGFAVADTLAPNRLVYGLPSDRTLGEAIKARLDECYASIIDTGVPVVVSDYATAELVKVAANSFLATKISFINAMAELCEATGADVTRLAEAIGYDDRIGAKFLQAGIGFGGGCLPKDIRAFMARAGELGVDQALTFLREVDAINLRRRDRAVSAAESLVGGRLAGKKVAVLGVAFKPDTDDLRDSPALDIASRLWSRGAELSVFDPAAGARLAETHPSMGVADSVASAVRDAHLVMVLTPWPEFVALDPAALRPLVASPNVLDGRNALDPHRWADAGWTYHGMGRGVPAW